MTESTKERTERLLVKLSQYDIDRQTVMDTYSEWAQNYDQDMSTVQYNPQSITADKALEFLGDTKTSALILDAAAGTGNVAIELKKRGFVNIDALDGSSEMLQQAEKKGLYRKLIHSMMGADYTLPIPDNTYDGVVITAAFVPGHVGGDCYDELIRVTKPGGLIITCFKEAYLYENAEYKDDIEGRAYRLADQGRWSVVERQVVPGYLNLDLTRAKEGNGVTFVFRVL